VGGPFGPKKGASGRGSQQPESPPLFRTTRTTEGYKLSRSHPRFSIRHPTGVLAECSPVSDVTRILEAIQQGDPHASEDLLPLVYEELRKLAAHKMSHEHPDQTLQPTALVHEAWLRLAGSTNQVWNSRGHFFAAAAEAMRRILIDRARKRGRERH